jgi:hypothetical protein
MEKNDGIGLGDLVEKVTVATGIKRVVGIIAPDCGCSKRKQEMNRIRIKNLGLRFGK